MPHELQMGRSTFGADARLSLSCSRSLLRAAWLWVLPSVIIFIAARLVGCAVVAGAAAGAGTGYIAGSEAAKSEDRKDQRD